MSVHIILVILLNFHILHTSISLLLFYTPSSPFQLHQREVFSSCIELLLFLNVLSRARSHSNIYCNIDFFANLVLSLDTHKFPPEASKVEKHFESFWIFQSSRSLEFPFPS